MEPNFFVKNRSPFFLVVLTFMLLVWMIPQLIFHPNDILLTADGDGLKSYYCFMYHLKFDESFLHFGGMNYPHGEHYLYTDGFPAIAWILQLLPFLKAHGIFMIHFTLFLSLLFTPLFIYLILKKFQVQDWIAILGAISLFILQPQFPRLFSHLSLAYSIFFPLSWYLLLRYKENRSSLKWFSLLLINQLFWYFTHPYLGFMITVFYGLDWFIQQWRKQAFIKDSVFGLILILLPVVLVQSIVMFTDSIKDRPTTPYGFFEYQAHWKSIFLPDVGPMHEWISTYISFDEFRWEGYAYIGFLSILMLLIGLALLVYFRWKKTVQISEMQQHLFPAVLAALFLLILSFGFPFNGNPQWLEHLRFLKQFRALGRFSWVFYYVIGVMGIYVLHLMYTQLRNLELTHRFKYKSFILVLGLLCMQICEGMSLLKIPKAFSKNIFDVTQLTAAEKKLVHFAKKKRNSVNALLPLPWFHIGSEINGKEVDSQTLKNTFLISAHTGIPIYAVMMGRTSKRQTLDYFHFFQNEQNTCLFKPSPLLIYQNTQVNLYQEDEQYLANQATTYFSNTTGNLSILRADKVNKKPSITTTEVLGDEFSDKHKWGDLIQHGRYRGKIEDYNTILRLDSTQLKPNEWYEISFDYCPDWSKPIANVCYLEFVDPKTKEVNWFYQRSIGSFPGIYKDHIHANIRFQAQSFPCEYHCFLIGNSTNIYFEIDHLKLKKLVE